MLAAHHMHFGALASHQAMHHDKAAAMAAMLSSTEEWPLMPWPLLLTQLTNDRHPVSLICMHVTLKDTRRDMRDFEAH